ncbi:MAG: hormogonium polysaccharide biosynthesis protein HpsA [Microcoleus sp.]
MRATQLDLNQLRGATAPTITNGPAPEYLLPNSGIIYASRDDALPDRSSRSANPLTDKTVSPTDNLLDPTRKPNGIVLINGQVLFRGGATPTQPADINAVVEEKGLTLVSNLPAYIKGNFNLHGNIPPAPPGTTPAFAQVEEFTQLVDNQNFAGTFYTRTINQLNPNFACRAGDPRLPNCTVGDFWRQATVLADAVTLLSQNYRFGFRNEGDFDLRNNAGAAAVLPRRQQGFYNNNFVTNGLSSGAFLPNGTLTIGTGNEMTDATYAAAPNPALQLSSSYFNNFVNPVQRRGAFPEYVMEVCTKLPVSECTDADWSVDPLATSPRTATAAGTPYVPPTPNPAISFQAGSTVDPPLPQLQRFPRRVAFQRIPGTTQLLNPNNPTPLGISNGTNIGATATINPGPLGKNALWFAENNGGQADYTNTNPLFVVNTPGNLDGSRVLLPTLAANSTTPPPAVTVPQAAYNGSQPLLMPFPQLMGATETAPNEPTGSAAAQGTGWVSQAPANGTTFNLTIGSGDTPSRALNNTAGDFNGGLQNFPRFLEIWSDNTQNTAFATNIQGSFIQQNRSAFSTAPYQPILPAAPPVPVLTSLFALSATPAVEPTNLASNPPNSNAQLSLTSYNIQNKSIPYFTPPARNWGFDVGLLSQPPDLFTQKFTTPSTKTQPAEYFREVGRDDPWVKTLMCSKLGAANGTTTTPATSSRPSNCGW